MTSNKSGRGVVIKDSPEQGTAAYAFADTLRAGTLIVEVNGEDAANFSRSDFTRFLDSNTREVTLVVRPDGGLVAFKSHGSSVRLPLTCSGTPACLLLCQSRLYVVTTPINCLCLADSSRQSYILHGHDALTFIST